MVSQILNKMGTLASSFLPSILQIILSLLSTCVFALEHREKVSQYRWITTCASDKVDHLRIRTSYEDENTTALMLCPLCDRIQEDLPLFTLLRDLLNQRPSGWVVIHVLHSYWTLYGKG